MDERRAVLELLDALPEGEIPACDWIAGGNSLSAPDRAFQVGVGSMGVFLRSSSRISVSNF